MFRQAEDVATTEDLLSVLDADERGPWVLSPAQLGVLTRAMDVRYALLPSTSRQYEAQTGAQVRGVAEPVGGDHLVAVRHREDLKYSREHDEPFVALDGERRLRRRAAAGAAAVGARALGPVAAAVADVAEDRNGHGAPPHGRPPPRRAPAGTGGQVRASRA